MISVFSLALVIVILGCTSATFSISYYHSDKNRVVNSGLHLANLPDATHVADLYTRLSGNAPILNEGKSPTFASHIDKVIMYDYMVYFVR